MNYVSFRAKYMPKSEWDESRWNEAASTTEDLTMQTKQYEQDRQYAHFKPLQMRQKLSVLEFNTYSKS